MRPVAPAWCAPAVRPQRFGVLRPRSPHAPRARWCRCRASGRGSAPAAASSRPTGGGRQRPAPMPATAMAKGTARPQTPRMRAATGSAMAAAITMRIGAAIARKAAGIQRAKRPSSASIRSTTMPVRCALWPWRRRLGPIESRRFSVSLRRRRRPAAPAASAALSASAPTIARPTAVRAKTIAAMSTGWWSRTMRARSRSAAAAACTMASSVPRTPKAMAPEATRRPMALCWRSQALAAFFVASMIGVHSAGWGRCPAPVAVDRATNSLASFWRRKTPAAPQCLSRAGLGPRATIIHRAQAGSCTCASRNHSDLSRSREAAVKMSAVSASPASSVSSIALRQALATAA